MLNPAGDEDVRNKNSIAPELAVMERQPMQIFGKRYPTYFYTNFLVKYPTVLCALFAFIPMLLTILSISVNPQVDRGISSFSILDHVAAKSYKTEQEAVSRWRELYDRSLVNAAADQLVGEAERSEQKYRVFINYRVNPDKMRKFLDTGLTDEQLRPAMNLLAGDKLEYIRTIERAINLLPGYASLCWRSSFRAGDVDSVSAYLPGCTPLNSILTYFYIGLFDNQTQLWEFDGRTGERQIPHESVLDRVFINPRFRWFMDQSATSDNRITTLMRTQVTLGWPTFAPSSRDRSSLAAYNEKVDALVARLVDLVNAVEPHQFIEVTIGGDRVDEGLVLRALERDAVFVTLSLLIVFLVLWHHCHSFVLGVLGVLQVAMTYPAGFFLYVACSGTESISLLSSLSLYVAMVIAVDAMMIWFDTFNHSGFMSTSGRKNTLTIAQRAAYTFRKAGVGISVSSLVTFVAFMINLASTVPAIRSFSGLMATLVAVNWFLMMTFYPSAVLFHHFHISGRRRNLQRQKEILVSRGQRARFPPQVVFHQELEALAAKHGITAYREAKEFMKAELAAEIVERKKERGFFERLGVEKPIRLPNPFKKHNEVEVAFADPRAEVSAKEAAIFMDQFADAVPDGRGGVVTFGAAAGAGSAHVVDPATVLQISNYNCDEMLAFDDTALRHRLMETGHRSAAEFRPDQLLAIAPHMGIQPASEKAAWRVANVARTAIYLLFGVARTLQLNPTALRAEQRAAIAAAAAATADGGGADGSPSSGSAHAKQPSRFDFLGRMSNWYSERRQVERKWCCGLLGQRVGETPAQHEERIMKKRIKHQGYSRTETFFFNKWAPMLHYLRVPLSLLGAFILAASIICTGFLTYSNEPPQFLGRNSLDEYEKVAVQYAETGNCDYCSAFFRPRTDFPKPDYEAILACARQSVHSTQMMHAWVDDCGICEGSNACIDCAGVRGGQARFDACNQCLEPTDFRFGNCSRCTWNTRGRPECSYCFAELSRGRHLYGNDCKIFCDPRSNCLPDHGTCNPITGVCECFSDHVRGFRENEPLLQTADSFTSFYCTRCINGFSGARCNVECTAADSGPCNCNVTAGRCTTCVSGLVGPTCTTRDRNVCDNGFMGAGWCQCDAGWEDGRACKYQKDCNYRGVVYAAALTPPGFSGCVCAGQFRGPSCGLCQCFNGGRCDAEGRCICPVGWEGVDCSSCPATCIAHGRCPLPWRASQYTIDQCRANFCSDVELRSGVVTTRACLECSAHVAFSSSSICGNFTESNCSGNAFDPALNTTVRCIVDPMTRLCVANITERLATRNEVCECKGAFGGRNCDTCIKPSGLSPRALADIRCLEDGTLVGCDNLPAVNGRLKVRDSCGFCGGACTGCDGIPGSTKVIDRCGVCGGNNECPGASSDGTIVRPTATVNFMFGLRSDGSRDPYFDPNDAALQKHMFQICAQFLAREDIVKSGQSVCVWYDFVQWATTVKRLPHPITNGRVVQLAYEFIKSPNGTGRAAEMGFNGTDPTDPNLRITYIRFSFRTANVYPYDNFEQQSVRYEFWKRLWNNVNNEYLSKSRAQCIMSSDAWVRYFTQQAAFKGTIFSMTLGGTVFVFAILTLTCSVTMSIIATMVLVSAVLSVLAVFFLLGWKIGPVEQVAMTFLLGASSEQIVHMTEGYLEYLHAAQSHMFARDTTALQAVKGMLQRTGVSITYSSITIIVCSSLLFAADMLIFNKVGAIVIIIVLSTLVHSVLIFGAVLCVGGPVTTFRNKKTMLVFGSVGCVLFTIICISLILSRAVAVE